MMAQTESASGETTRTFDPWNPCHTASRRHLGCSASRWIVVQSRDAARDKAIQETRVTPGLRPWVGLQPDASVGPRIDGPVGLKSDPHAPLITHHFPHDP